MTLPTPNLGLKEFYQNYIPIVEKSFAITFSSAELAPVCTVDDLRQLVQAKLPLQAFRGSHLQAFYKLKRILLVRAKAEHIQLSTALSSILPPGRQRQQMTEKLTRDLGISFPLLRVSASVSLGGAALVLASVVCLFFSRLNLTGQGGLALAVIGLDIAHKRRNTLRFSSVRDLVVALAAQNYLPAVANPLADNPRVVGHRIRMLLAHYLKIPVAHITPATRLFH